MTPATLLPDEAAFLHALDVPGDHLSMLVFADYLADHSDPRETGYRELARIGFVPWWASGSRIWGTVDHSWGQSSNLLPANRVPNEWISAVPASELWEQMRPEPLFKWHSNQGLFTNPNCPATNRPSTLIDALARAYATMPRA